MKTILLITDTFPYGGAEPFVENEIKSLKGFEMVYVAPVGVTTTKDKRNVYNKVKVVKTNVQRLNVLKRIYYTIKCLFTKEFWLEESKIIRDKKWIAQRTKLAVSFLVYALERTHQLKAIMRKIDIGEFIIQSSWMYVGAYVGIMIGKEFGCSIVTRCHRCDLYETESKYNYLPFREYILENVNKVYCISKDAVNYLNEKYPTHVDKFLLSRLGTYDLGIQHYQKTGTIRIVSCSYMIPVKRINLIIDALALVTEQSIQWYHYGDGPLRFEIEQYAQKKLCTSANVSYSFRGAIEHAQLMSEYSNSIIDLFINTSESEGVPVSIMEALSFGIPVVATNVGGTSEIVSDGIDGYLLDKEFQPEELARRLNDYCNYDIDRISNLRRNARNKWENECSIDSTYVKHWEELAVLNEQE